jgi:hypothetical protein
MEYNAYAPPQAEVADLDEQARQTPYYVVGKTKFFALYWFTLTTYQFVWFYLHWRNYRRSQRDPVSPFWRSLFQIFYFHSLTDEIRQSLSRARIAHAWSPWWLATTCVGFGVVNFVLAMYAVYVPVRMEFVAGRLFVYLLVNSLLLWQIQKAANVASGDPAGLANRRYTLLNWFWTLFCTLRWAGLILVFYQAFVLGAGGR